jgi:hypothetical protein
MITVLALIKRLPALDRAAFRDHYENRHVAVAAPLLRHLVRYARYHVEAELHGRVDFDVVTSFGYPDKAALDAMFATLASDAAEPILEDERRFMDKPANRFFETSERVWPIGEAAGEEGDRSIFVFVGRPPGMTRTECSRSLLRDHWPVLVEGVPELRRAIVRDAFPMAGRPLAFDGVMQLSSEGGADVRRFAAGLSEKGFRVAAIRTRRFVTPVPQGG